MPDPPTPNNSFNASPGPIDDILIENFNTLKRAFDEGHGCLISAIRNGSHTPMPFAEMLMCNPFESYIPPNPN